MRRGMIFALVLVLTTASIPGVAAADEYPDDCNDANVGSASGQYRGVFDSPNDWDHLKIALDKGEYISVTALAPSEAGSYFIRQWGEDYQDVTVQNVTNGQQVRHGVELNGGIQASWELWAERDNTVFCIQIHGADTTPVEWQLNVAKNQPEPIGFEVTELQAELEDKNERIAELEAQVEELKSESQDVSLTVEVRPSGAQESFVAGSKAVVFAQGENADLSQLSVTYQGESYSMDDSGEIAIPVVGSGSQSMTFQYGGTSEEVSLNVQAQPTESEGSTEEMGGATEANNGNPGNGKTEDTDGDGVPDSEDYAPRDSDVQDRSDLQTSSGSGPGFTLALGVATIVGVALLGRYKWSQ